jgi:hypothetical protein
MVLPPSPLSQQAQRMTTVNISSSANEPKVPVTPFAIKPQSIEFQTKPSGYHAFSSQEPAVLPNITAEAFRTSQYPNIARQGEAVTFAHPVNSVTRNKTWTQEIHRLDFAHRQVIITKEHLNLHPQGLLTVQTEYVDWHTYHARDSQNANNVIRLTVTSPPAFYKIDS